MGWGTCSGKMVAQPLALCAGANNEISWGILFTRKIGKDPVNHGPVGDMPCQALLCSQRMQYTGAPSVRATRIKNGINGRWI